MAVFRKALSLCGFVILHIADPLLPILDGL